MTYAEHSGHAHYVTIREHQRTALAAGPFLSRREAEAQVEPVRQLVRGQSFSDVYSTAFLAFGTARVTLRNGARARAGRLNTALGLS
jgi:hypothetical protein